MNPDQITIKAIYDAMGWEDPDLWLGKRIEENWERLRKEYIAHEHKDIIDLSVQEVLDLIARRSGRTTQLCVKAILKALEGDKVLICAPHISAARQIELIVYDAWKALSLKANLSCWIKVEAIGNQGPCKRNTDWADLILEDHTCEKYK